MPERLDRVTLTLSGGDVTLTWATREALLARLQHVNSASGIRIAFTAIGATRPVDLSVSQQVALLKVLDEWTPDGGDGMPASLLELRDALTDEMADDE